MASILLWTRVLTPERMIPNLMKWETKARKEVVSPPAVAESV